MSNIAKKEKRQLFSNFFSLLSLQGTNYILPLITFPYLIQVLDVEYFGLLAFATAMIMYFNVITDYGFNMSATREISIYRDDKEKINEIFSAVMSIKIVLMLICLVLLTIIVFSFDKFSSHWEVYFLTFCLVVGQVLFPIWFFQGMEKMKYISYLNILSKVLFTVAIFIFVKEQNDFYLVPMFSSIGSIIAGVWSLVLIYREFNIRFKIQSLEVLKGYLYNGWHIFISKVYVNIYTTTNIILLGTFTNNIAVGYYSIAEKVVTAIGGVFQPANQTIYPYLARKYKENFEMFLSFIKKVALIFLTIAFIFFLLSEYFKDSIVFLITGSENIEVTMLLMIFLLKVLTYPFGSLFSNSLIIMDRKKEFMKVMNYTVLLDLLIVPISIYFYQEMGLVISYIVVSFSHVFLLIYYFKKSISLSY